MAVKSPIPEARGKRCRERGRFEKGVAAVGWGIEVGRMWLAGDLRAANETKR